MEALNYKMKKLIYSLLTDYRSGGASVFSIENQTDSNTKTLGEIFVGSLPIKMIIKPLL